MTRRSGLLLLMGLLLAGCGVNVRWSGIAEPPVRSEEARAVPMRFGQLQARLRRGEVIGEYVIGFTCLGPFDTITWAANRRLLDRDDVADIFYEELSAAGT
jgi:serine protease Do